MPNDKKYTNVLFMTDRDFWGLCSDVLKRVAKSKPEFTKHDMMREALEMWIKGKPRACLNCGSDFDIEKNQCVSCDFTIPF